MELSEIFKDVPGIEVAPKLNLFSGDYLFSKGLEEIPMLFGKIIPKVGVFSIVGSSDTGKSMLFRQMAIDCVRGCSFLGWQNNAVHRRSLVVSTEDDENSIGFLLRKQAQTSDELDRIDFIFDTENLIEKLEMRLAESKLDLIIIDAWGDVIANFEKADAFSNLTRSVLNKFRDLAIKYECAIGFLHHTGKRTQKLTPSKDNILSGQGFEAKMRLVFELRLDTESSDLRQLCIVKGNYVPSSEKTASYELRMCQDTFNFSPTGNRISFDELAEKEPAATSRKSTKPFEITNEMHSRLLSDIFNGEPILAKEFKLKIGNVYGKHFDENFGRDKIDAYITHLDSIQLIEQVGTPKTRNSAYKLNQT